MIPLPMSDEPDDTDDDDTCCICGQPAIDFYDDRQDCPSCGRWSCELKMQGGILRSNEL